MANIADLIANRNQELEDFKQKTAYEIIAGDWSSDVCSSDLHTSQSLLLSFQGFHVGLSFFLFSKFILVPVHIKCHGTDVYKRQERFPKAIMKALLLSAQRMKEAYFQFYFPPPALAYLPE